MTNTDFEDDTAELNRLRGAAMAGDIAAKMHLTRRLIGMPQNGNELIEGVAVTLSAANDGNGEAAYLSAVLAAGAIAMKRNWAAALVYLQRAAELGHGPAQMELAALSSDTALAARALEGNAPADAWATLRKSIDLKNHMTPPRPKTLGVSPRMAVAENFASPALCDYLIAQASPRLQPLPAVDGSVPGVEAAAAMRFSIPDFNLQTILLLDRIAEITHLPHRGLEAPAVLRFARNTPFPPHADYLDPGDLDLRDQLIAEGQRLVTFLLFLNDDYEGGETDFPNVPRQFKGKKGDALFWWNLDPDGGLEPAAHNGNLAVTQGEKFVLSQWIRIPALQRGA
jgi:prolyl 4-hydroxylase